MKKIIWGVSCLVIVLATVLLSGKQDEVREVSYDQCEVKFINNAMPLEGREGYLQDCMK